MAPTASKLLKASSRSLPVAWARRSASVLQGHAAQFARPLANVQALAGPAVFASRHSSSANLGIRKGNFMKEDPGQGHPISLRLENGMEMHGKSFGAKKEISGEFVFATGMTGYPEMLTDPSYSGQILVLTYPIVGNYGAPDAVTRDPSGLLKYVQSQNIHISGLVVQNYTHEWSHWQGTKSLHKWLVENDIPGIFDVDTRELTKTLRDGGVCLGKLGARERLDDIALPPYETTNQSAKVCEMSDLPHLFTSYQQGRLPAIEGGPNILMVDTGMKHSIVRRFLERGCNVKVVPWDFNIEDEVGEADGIFISNGPGNPNAVVESIENVRKVLSGNKPIWGICQGNQILGLAAGTTVEKMKFGHRGVNQPVRNILTGAVTITSQNHGYEVKAAGLPDGWRQFVGNLNDGTNEGIICDDKPFYSVQFHPEACAGPLDSDDMFGQFAKICAKQRDHLRSSSTDKWWFEKSKRPWTEILTKPLREDGLGNYLTHSDSSADITQMIHIDAVKKDTYMGEDGVASPTHTLPAKKVLILGSGGLQVGQAGEFDYSGSQAIKALKEEGIETILINPNIATVMTAEGLADKVYFHPVTMDFVTKIIEKEEPDGLMLQFGGQTALNTGLQLDDGGILSKFNCRILGTSTHSIRMTEDRDLFKKAMIEIGEPICESAACNDIAAALVAAKQIGYPVILRAAFSLGGLGSGFAHDPGQLEDMAGKAFTYSDQVLIEKSVKGWKEAEYEVVRDRYNNCITVCNMENFDPMGIHTGDSIVVAPSQTLTDFEYNMLREASINTVRKLQIQGECNVQFGIDPHSHEYCIIECNPRLSRSSALASKATGYPLAFVAAKLALGYSLHEVRNKVTKVTPAAFEPSLDYIVTKFPRWDFAKFKGAQDKLGSGMQSVGEVMAIGRSFEESFMKAIRMQTQFKLEGLVPSKFKGYDSLNAHLREANHERIYHIASAFKEGYSVSKVHDMTRVDPWFLNKLQHIQAVSEWLERSDSMDDIDAGRMRNLKQLGFTDKAIASLIGDIGEMDVRTIRKELGVTPVVKQIDTLAAEFPAATNYLYMTYHGTHHDIPFGKDNPKPTDALVLGGGCYKIGTSVEFDYSCVGVARTFREQGKSVALINFNPETVSTDYDESDRLYFEELSLERVLDIHDLEQVKDGVVVSVGGQIPNELCLPLHNLGVKVLGTCPTDIDNAEDRSKFSALCDANGIKQPAWMELTDLADVQTFVGKVGFPILCRPSYVLSGGGMEVIYDEAQLTQYLKNDAVVSAAYPVTCSKFYTGCFEADIDAVAQNGNVLCYAIADHIELAGTHSGDAHLVLPPHRLSQETQDEIADNGRKMASMLNISGPFNAQFIITPEGEVLVIECNVRASRSLPFMAKTVRQDMVQIVGKVLLGQDMSAVKPVDASKLGYVGVKAPQFSWTRLKGCDPRCGVEMSSTGEVATFATTAEEAYLMSLHSTHIRFPRKRIMFSAKSPEDVEACVKLCQDCVGMEYQIFATEPISDALALVNVEHVRLNNTEAVDALKDKKVDTLFSIPSKRMEDKSFESVPSGEHFAIRRAAVDYSTPVQTELEVVKMYVRALAKVKSFNTHSYGELLKLAQP